MEIPDGGEGRRCSVFARALCTLPFARLRHPAARSRGPGSGKGVHVALHQLEVTVCRLRTPTTESVASKSPKKGWCACRIAVAVLADQAIGRAEEPRAPAASAGNALAGYVDVIRRGVGQGRTHPGARMPGAAGVRPL